MNKGEFIAAVANTGGMTKKDAEAAVSAVFDTITESLKKGDKIQISGFGTFDVKHRAARKGLNPLTKQPLDIAASNAASFKAGKALKEALN